MVRVAGLVQGGRRGEAGAAGLCANSTAKAISVNPKMRGIEDLAVDNGQCGLFLASSKIPGRAFGPVENESLGATAVGVLL